MLSRHSTLNLAIFKHVLKFLNSYLLVIKYFVVSTLSFENMWGDLNRFLGLAGLWVWKGGLIQENLEKGALKEP
jgi:hypothetical protein